jgi:translation initiation factor 2 beta subunit (eIF-2beta)/eIF-5
LTDLSELFAKDKLGYSKQDIDEMIEYFRKKYVALQTTGKPERDKIDLHDLGLLS